MFEIASKALKGRTVIAGAAVVGTAIAGGIYWMKDRNTASRSKDKEAGLLEGEEKNEISLHQTILSESDINKRIQKKFCKVVSEYGEGTGYIIDDEELLILSSFHLVGGVKCPSITDMGKIGQNNYVKSILFSLDFMDAEFD